MGRATRIAFWSTAALLVVYTFALAPHGHYSADAGVKLIQAHDLWENGFASRALRHDRALDPSGKWYRTGRGFERRVGGARGERQGIYSIVFVAPAAVLAGLFGFAGTLALPLAGSLLLAAALARLLARLGCRDAIAAAALAFTMLATPLLFYTAQLFEHTLATALVTLALAMLAGEAPGGDGRRGGRGGGWRAAAAGAAAGLAATMRPEAYCALTSLALWPLVEPGPARRRAARAAALILGAAAVVGGYWALNLVTAATWDPLVAVNGKTTSLHTARTMLWGDVRRAVGWTWALPVVLVGFAALLPPRLRRGRGGAALLALAGAAVAVAAVVAQQHSRARILTGVFTVTPLALLGVARGPWAPRTRGLWCFAVSFIAQVLLLERTGSGGGLQFGARLLLPALPACIGLAASIVDGLGAGAGEGDAQGAGEGDAQGAGEGDAQGAGRLLPLLAATALAVVSVMGQITGMRQGLGIAQAGAAAADHAAAAPGRLVVARLEWQAGVLSPALFRGKDIVITRDADNRGLFRRIAERGDAAFVYVNRDPPDPTLATRNGPRPLFSQAWESARIPLLGMQTVTIGSPASVSR